MEKEKNEIKRQVFFIYLSFRIAFLVCFWENVWFTSYVACYYCVVPAGKHLNSRSQKFYKINAFKNLAIFTGKHFCWRFFIINFIKKRFQHRCFPVNIAKCLSAAFYICEYAFFEYYDMLSFFFRRCSCKAWLKVTLQKTNRSKNYKAAWSMHQHENWQKRKCKVYCCKLQG